MHMIVHYLSLDNLKIVFLSDLEKNFLEFFFCKKKRQNTPQLAGR